MVELDIFADTTADNPFEDTTAAQEQSEGRMYDYTNQREDGGSQNLYWGNSSRQVTEDELRELYNASDNARLRESFGTFDNYLAYMNERQDLIESGEYKADWWNTGTPLVSEETLADPEAGMDDREFERDVMEEGARQGEIGYNEQADIFQSLYEKYTGESTTKYLDNGAKYEWNGTSFVLTQEAFGAHLGSIVGDVAATAIISGAATAGMSLAISGLTGVSTATANAIANAAVAGMTGEDLDPADALSFAFNTLLPGSGEVVEADAIENAIDQMVGILTDPDNYIKDETGGVEVVWDDIDYEDIEGEFDPDNPDNSYDPDLIDPQLPKLPEEDDGGGGAAEDPSADEDVSAAPSEDETEEEAEDEFVYDPEHDFIYRGNGVYEQVGEDGEPTGVVYEDPNFESEEEYPAVVGDAYSIPGTSGAEGSIEPTTEGEEEEDDGGITLGGSPVWDGGADDEDDVTLGGDDAEAGDADSGDADEDADGDGTEGTGDEGAGDDGVGDDGTGEGDGGDGEGDGDGDGQKEVSLGGGMMGKPASFQGMMAGLSYEPQPIPGIRPTPQIDYAADLEALIARQLKNRGMFT